MLYDVMEGLVVDAHIGKYRMNERESAMKHIDSFMKLKITVNEYSGVKYITRPAIGNQSSVFVEITIPANRKSLYLINPYNEIIRHLV